MFIVYTQETGEKYCAKHFSVLIRNLVLFFNLKEISLKFDDPVAGKGTFLESRYGNIQALFRLNVELIAQVFMNKIQIFR